MIEEILSLFIILKYHITTDEDRITGELLKISANYLSKNIHQLVGKFNLAKERNTKSKSILKYFVYMKGNRQKCNNHRGNNRDAQCSL